MDHTIKTIIHNGVTINIHRPILTEKERAKRETRVVETLNNIQIRREGEKNT